MPAKNVGLMIEVAKRQMAGEMPEEYKRATFVPMGDTSRNALMETNPENRVDYNPELLKNYNQNDINDIMAHELVHVRQNKTDPPSVGGLIRYLLNPLIGRSIPYAQDPAELEGWQMMKDRAMREHRDLGVIQPPFSGGNQRIGNIYLPKDKK